MSPELQTFDLISSVPPGLKLRGFSAVHSEGAQPFRVPAQSAEVAFQTAEARYVAFRSRLSSGEQEVRASVTLDGRPIGTFAFPAGQSVAWSFGGFVKAGPHVLRFRQGCLTPCAVRQELAQMTLVPVPLAQQPVGFSDQKLNFDVERPVARPERFSAVQFDGAHLMRTLEQPAPGHLVFSSPQRLVSLSYLSASDGGPYRLQWRADGQSPRSVQADAFQEGVVRGDVLPRRTIVKQYVTLDPTRVTAGLEVSASCVGGGTACFPVRLYSLQVVARGEGGLPLQAVWLGVGLLVFTLLLLRWLLFRPLPPAPGEAEG